MIAACASYVAALCMCPLVRSWGCCPCLMAVEDLLGFRSSNSNHGNLMLHSCAQADSDERLCTAVAVHCSHLDCTTN